MVWMDTDGYEGHGQSIQIINAAEKPSFKRSINGPVLEQA